MPTRAMNNRTFVEPSSSSGSGGSGEPEPATVVLCAPRPRRVQVHPCSADLILNVTNKVRTDRSSPPYCCCCSCVCLQRFCFSPQRKEEGKADKAPAEVEIDDGDEDGGWAMFGGSSPPARADNPLVHDPHFLLNQRHHSPSSELGIFGLHHLSRNGHRPTYAGSSSNLAPSLAPAVRVQGFDVASCRSSHGVLSARA
jgi:hypothetical protein